MYNSYQNFNPYMQPYAQRPDSYMQSQIAQIKGRPVTSIDEVRAAQIDFDGSISFFPDVANKKIYTKQINLDGTAAIRVYEAEDTAPTPSYVTKEELDSAIANLQNLINARKEDKHESATSTSNSKSTIAF